jgi:hypothetical protein
MFPTKSCVLAALVTIAAGPPPAHLEPQAIQIAQKETLEQLTALTRHKGPVGVEAAKVLVLMKHHIAEEQAFIMPPLTLLPYLADNAVTADMAAWALPMIDRVKAERGEIFAEHTQITEGLNALVAAAVAAHDKSAQEFAENAAADALADMEILEPTLLLIGDTLRAKSPARK